VVTDPTTIETLAATYHGLDVETLTERKVLVHQRTMFYPRTCGFRRGTAALIGYVDMRLMSGQIRGGDL
jgi:hypothetical protein